MCVYTYLGMNEIQRLLKMKLYVIRLKLLDKSEETLFEQSCSRHADRHTCYVIVILLVTQFNTSCHSS